MSDLVPVEQKQVLFYDDEITAVRLADGRVFVPIRPICNFLGVAWDPQRRRINRDPVLNAESKGVTVTVTPSSVDGRGGGAQEMICLPLKYLPGWLFGISASRVRDVLREKIIRYQRECYDVLADAFQEGRLTAATDFETLLDQASGDVADAYIMAAAVMKLARNQVLLESRIDAHERYLAAHDDRLEQVEETLGLMGDELVVTNDQASQISQAVKALAISVGKQSGQNEFGRIYGEMYRKFGVTSYKLIPAAKFRSVMEWLTEWLNSIG